jgi:hypothetical protein
LLSIKDAKESLVLPKKKKRKKARNEKECLEQILYNTDILCTSTVYMYGVDEKKSRLHSDRNIK